MVVNASVPHERCPTCGYYELDADVAELIEVQAAIVVMSETTEPDLKAVRTVAKPWDLLATLGSLVKFFPVFTICEVA